MELRTVNEDKPIAQREITMRYMAGKSFQGYSMLRRGSRGSVAAVRGMASGVAKVARGGTAQVKKMLLSGDQRKQLQYLTREQRKQWNTYSHSKQMQILAEIDRKVEKRQKYRKPDASINLNGTGRIRRETWNKERYRSKKRRHTRKQSGMEQPKVFMTAPRCKVPDIKGASISPEAAAAIKRSTRSGKYSDVVLNKGILLSRKLNRLASGNRGDRWTVPLRNGKEVTFYTSNINKGARKVAKIEKQYNKAIKRETALRRDLFLRELGNMLEKDARKSEQITKMQRNMQISEAQRRIESQIIQTLSVPVRIWAKKVWTGIKAKMIRTAYSLLKILLPFAGILLVLFILVSVLMSALNSLEDEGDAGASATGYEIVEYAKQWIGVTKYVWGYGRGYDTDWQDYADCSSFAHGVYAHFGYEIGGTTLAQENSGTEVEGGIANAAPGDLILFYSGSSPSHAAIYAGDGKMIHCAGGPANYSPATAGPGVCWGNPNADGRPFKVRRIVTDTGDAGNATGGHRTDNTAYSRNQLELIWAIVAQEDNGSYAGALAVISTAMNRVDSPRWSYCGRNALEQLTAPGQFCYSIDNYWQARLGGNVPEYVKRAVDDCLKKGIRNHPYTCFRSTKGSETGANAVQIGGGNWYFGD